MAGTAGIAAAATSSVVREAGVRMLVVPAVGVRMSVVREVAVRMLAVRAEAAQEAVTAVVITGNA